MISLIINVMLAGLLLTCIIYCIRLEKRIRTFQSANVALGESVAQLARLTIEAEEAVQRFRAVAAESEAQLATPVANARSLSTQLEQQIDDAEEVMNRIGRIVGAAAPAPAAPPTSGGRRRQPDVHEHRSRSRFAGIG